MRVRRVGTVIMLAFGLPTLAIASGLAASQQTKTATPIHHLVVIFDENISFDHYFGTYPHALNSPGEPRFVALPGTPRVNGLTGALLSHNPNGLNTAVNGKYASNPFRLDRSQAATASEDHAYRAEQLAFDRGLMDSFPLYTGVPGRPHGEGPFSGPSQVLAPPMKYTTKALTMGYYDGNTVTALWNYAQHYAMDDNSYGTTFGPSTLGAINLISGQTNGVTEHVNAGNKLVPGGSGTWTEVGDAAPLGDVCSPTSKALLRHGGNNIGEMLSRKDVTWGWFQGGFDLTRTNPNGATGCQRSTYSNITHVLKLDYSPDHEPFQYYLATANLNHARPTSVMMIGHNGDRGRHQYDVDDFYAAVRAGNFPSVSFLKAPSYQDGHAGYSDPLDEQAWLVKVINFVESQPEWKSTAIVIAYDDSDGWYDHQIGPIVNHSRSKHDALSGPGECGDSENALPGPNTDHAQGRCGYGPRLPLLVISPYSRQNYVDHSLTDQTSIIRFIEDNWLSGERVGHGSFDAIAGSIDGMFDFEHPHDQRMKLNPSTGEVVSLK